MAPLALRSPAVTGRLSRVCATTMRESRASSSSRSAARQKQAMTSEATVMSNPSSRGWPFFAPPRPTMVARSARSFMSMTRRQTMRRVSMPSALPQ